ncbi:unnamed protein product [Ranitomeya imitator]|uniref:10 kDa heat shock protein, mitochondrial n=1 Tax=Ranitomeya imitator TaxID=111125 RepID=A0ABN9LU25_9NEOB|nr:unnamed protein product [Ranitomeya imitator]
MTVMSQQVLVAHQPWDPKLPLAMERSRECDEERERRRMAGKAFKTFLPLLDRVLVERIAQETVTKGGIMLPEKSQNKVLQAVVVAVGGGSKGKYMDNDDSRIRGRLCPSLIGRGNLYDIIVAMATIMTSTSILCPSLNQKNVGFLRPPGLDQSETRDVYVLYDIIVTVPVADWSRPGDQEH